MDLGQALLLVLSFPALAILLAAVTLIEERVLGGPAASPPGNQPETGDMQVSPSPYDPTRPMPSAHLPQHDHVLPAVTHDGGPRRPVSLAAARAGLARRRRADRAAPFAERPAHLARGGPVSAWQRTKAQ